MLRLLKKWDNLKGQEFEVVGFFVFSHIRMMGYFRLGYLRFNDCPAGLEHLG